MSWIVEVRGANFQSENPNWGPAVLTQFSPDDTQSDEQASTFSSKEIASSVYISFVLAAAAGAAFDSACIFRIREIT